MPIITMSSASLKFYLLSLILICALSWSTSMPSMARRPPCQLTQMEREKLYNKLPAVADERLADAERDIAYNLCDPSRPS